MKKILLGILIGWFLYPTLLELDELDFQFTFNKTYVGGPAPEFKNLTERFQWIEQNRHLHFIDYLVWRPEFSRCYDSFNYNKAWYCGRIK